MVAVSATVLTQYTSGTGLTDYTTASYAPGSSKTILAFILANKAFGECPAPVMTGNGLTWTSIATVYYDTAGQTSKMFVYRASGSSPTTGTLNVDFNSQTDGCDIIVVELDGTDVTTTDGVVTGNVSAVAQTTANGTTVSFSLSAFAASSNACIAFYAFNTTNLPATSAITQPSGHTELVEDDNLWDIFGVSFQASEDTAGTATLTGDSNQKRGIIAFEITAASSGTAYTETGLTAGMSLGCAASDTRGMNESLLAGLTLSGSITDLHRMLEGVSAGATFGSQESDLMGLDESGLSSGMTFGSQGSELLGIGESELSTGTTLGSIASDVSAASETSRVAAVTLGTVGSDTAALTDSMSAAVTLGATGTDIYTAGTTSYDETGLTTGITVGASDNDVQAMADSGVAAATFGASGSDTYSAASYTFPGTYASTDWICAYDGTEVPGTAGSDVTAWTDQGSGSRDLSEETNSGAPPIITDSYFGSVRAVKDNYSSPATIPGLAYYTASPIETGELVLYLVVHVISFVDSLGSGDAIVSASQTGGSSTTTKHVFGLFDVSGTIRWVGLNNPDGNHHFWGTVTENTAHVLAMHVKNDGNVDYYDNGVLIDNSYFANDINDAADWRLFSREDGGKPCNAAIGFFGIAAHDGYSSTNIAATISDLGTKFNITTGSGAAYDETGLAANLTIGSSSSDAFSASESGSAGISFGSTDSDRQAMVEQLTSGVSFGVSGTDSIYTGGAYDETGRVAAVVFSTVGTDIFTMTESLTAGVSLGAASWSRQYGSGPVTIPTESPSVAIPDGVPSVTRTTSSPSSVVIPGGTPSVTTIDP